MSYGMTIQCSVIGLAGSCVYIDQDWWTCGTRAKLSRGIHSCPNLFCLFAQPASLYCEEYVCVCVYIYVCDCIESIYVLPLLPNSMTSETLCTQIGSGAKCWLDIYHWSAGLAVTGRILDIGQNVLQSSFRGGSCNTLSYFQIFLLIAFLQEAFIRNII
jgi:hypothetical protein